MENIFNNVVDISKVIPFSNTVNTETSPITKTVNPAVVNPVDNPVANPVVNPIVTIDNSSRDIISLNNLLTSNVTHDVLEVNVIHNNNNPILGNITSIMQHINELNEKIIYHNTLATLKEKENQQLLNDNKNLRANLELIKRRFNLK